MRHKMILITGGARSGKSAYALKLGKAFSKKAYVATAQALDQEMRERIEKHRKERGASFATIEAPLELTKALQKLSPGFDFVLVDCLTFWLSNLLLKVQNPSVIEQSVEKFLNFFPVRPFTLALVSNEVGMGVVPDSELGRKFRDLQGKLNQQVAERADEVIFMVSGLPVFVKGRRRGASAVKKEESSYAVI